MNTIKLLAIFLMLITALPAIAQKSNTLTSPDGNIVFSFELTPKAPVCRVAYKGETLIKNSELGLSFKEAGSFKAILNMLDPQFDQSDNTYNLIVGRAKRCATNTGRLSFHWSNERQRSVFS